MPQDHYSRELAFDDSTGLTVPDAQADVYAVTDTLYTTPLPIFDATTGLPLAHLVASPNGVFQKFLCPGHTEVQVKSGALVTLVSSRYGHVFEVIPNPSDVDDGYTIVSSGGVWVAAPLPGAGVGQRAENTYTTASLASLARELGVVSLGKTVVVLRIEVDKYCRVRLYDTTAHRDADATRALGVDPDPLSNTGVLLDIELDPAVPTDMPWTLTPPATVGSFTGSVSVPITVDNLDATSGTVGVTFTFVILEG